MGKKAMIIVFFNGHDMDLIDILSQNQKVTAEYFAEHIIPSLVLIYFLGNKRFQDRKCMVHFDNAPRHNSKISIGKFVGENLNRMPHPSYRPGRLPC
jgi:hypothetical protein